MNRFLQLLDYTDDICLLSHKISDIWDLIRSLEVEAASAGQKINCGKTTGMAEQQFEHQLEVAAFRV